jgi:hypothetical protein
VQPVLWETDETCVARLVEQDTLFRGHMDRVKDLESQVKQAEEDKEFDGAAFAKLKSDLEQAKTKAENALVQIYQRFIESVTQDEAFMHEFDFTKLAPIVVYKLVTEHRTNKFMEIPSLVNDSTLLVQLAAHVRELTEEEQEKFSIDGSILKKFTLQQLDKLAELTPWFKTNEDFQGTYF